MDTVRAILLFFYIYFPCSISTFCYFQIPCFHFPFSYHSFQTDPRAGFAQNPRFLAEVSVFVEISRICFYVQFEKFCRIGWRCGKYRHEKITYRYSMRNTGIAVGKLPVAPSWGAEARVTAIYAYGLTYLLGALCSAIFLFDVRRFDTILSKPVSTYGTIDSADK